MVKELNSYIGGDYMEEFRYVNNKFLRSNINMEERKMAIQHIKPLLVDMETGYAIDSAIFNKIVELSSLNIKDEIVCDMQVEMDKSTRAFTLPYPLMDGGWTISTAESFAVLSFKNKSNRFVGLVLDMLHELRHIKQFEDGDNTIFPKVEYHLQPHEMEARIFSYIKLVEIWPSLLNYILNELINDI